MDEDTPTILKDPRWIPVAVGLLAFGAGVGLGYILGRRNSYEVIKLGDRLPESRPPKVIIDVDELNKDKTEIESATFTRDIVTVNDEVIESNLFAATEGEDDHWDIDEEVKRRTPLTPYIIHRDEFFAEEMATEDYIQSTLTYYAGDGVLVDEEEKPIYNQTDIVGELRFGHGSGDPNCVYIRNMSRQTEYEVLRDPGHYRIEVLGLELENEERAKDLKHSRERKFRPE